MTTSNGTLYIISAPSGGGKTSLVNALLKAMPNLEVSISYTTRTPRPGEQDHVNYHFVNEAEFVEHIKQNDLLEYANVFGNYYGTPCQWVNAKLQAGTDIILEIDWQGAQQVRQLLPESISIFLIPPGWDIIQSRLSERAQDNPDIISRRMAAARMELSHYHEYDYLVVNDDFATALADLQSIIHARRLRGPIQQQKNANLLANLLA